MGKDRNATSEQESKEATDVQTPSDQIEDIVDTGGELVDKGDLEGHVILVSSWKENPSRFTGQTPTPGQAANPSTYLVFKANDACSPKNRACLEDEAFSFAGGVVLDRQAREMNGPFRGRLVMPKGKRYWVFRAPNETREDKA